MERRDFLETLSHGATALWAGLNLRDLFDASAWAAARPVTAPYEFFSPEQAALVDAISATLVPTTDTPGAREAHVVQFMDHALATFMKERQKPFTDALAGFTEFVAQSRPGGAAFPELAEADQIAVMTEYEKKNRQPFNLLRSATMMGMFCHPQHGGNYQKVGWQLIGFVDQYSWVPPFGYYDRT